MSRAEEVPLQVDPRFSPLFELPLMPIGAPIESHAAFLYSAIYARLPRKYEIVSASRMALYVPVLVNMWRKYESTVVIQEEDIKRLQLTILLSKAISLLRIEGKKASALMYLYLTHIGISEDRALLFARLALNVSALEDSQDQFFFEEKRPAYLSSRKNESEALVFEEGSPISSFEERLVFILHDVGLLERFSLHEQVIGERFCFYEHCVKKLSEDSQKDAIEVMAKMLLEARSLIHLCGETLHYLDSIKRDSFVVANCFESVLSLIVSKPQFFLLNPKNLPDLEGFLQRGLFNADRSDVDYLSDANLLRALQEGKIFCRSEGVPSAMLRAQKPGRLFDDPRVNETSVAKTVRKMLRFPGIPTLTKKRNNAEKHGNPFRSLSVIGHGMALYAYAGFGFVDISAEHIRKVAAVDIDTGRGKKEYLQELVVEPSTVKESFERLMLEKKLSGGTFLAAPREDAMPASSGGRVYYHSELIIDIKQRPDMIVFSADPNGFYCEVMPCFSRDSSVPFFEALYIRDTYKKMVEALPDLPQYAEIKAHAVLPVFEYSGINNTFVRCLPSDDHVLQLWKKEIDRYFNKNPRRSFSEPIDLIKSLVCYEGSLPLGCSGFEPLDTYYSVALKAQIDQYLSQKIADRQRSLGEASAPDQPSAGRR